ncbi:hypothetical protein ACJX0J_041127, partial [Zea mays]
VIQWVAKEQRRLGDLRNNIKFHFSCHNTQEFHHMGDFNIMRNNKEKNNNRFNDRLPFFCINLGQASEREEIKYFQQAKILLDDCQSRSFTHVNMHRNKMSGEAYHKDQGQIGGVVPHLIDEGLSIIHLSQLKASNVYDVLLCDFQSLTKTWQKKLINKYLGTKPLVTHISDPSRGYKIEHVLTAYGVLTTEQKEHPIWEGAIAG